MPILDGFLAYDLLDHMPERPLPHLRATSYELLTRDLQLSADVCQLARGHQSAEDWTRLEATGAGSATLRAVSRADCGVHAPTPSARRARA